MDELRPDGGSAEARRHQRPRRHGAIDDGLRRQGQARLHDLQGAADRAAAREDVAQPDQGGHLGRRSAVLSARRRRRHPHRRRRGSQPGSGQARRRRQHHHAAARAPELPDSRQDLPPQAEGNRPRQLHRERVLEERHPPDVPEQGVFRRRALRRRSRRARVSRKERFGSDRGRGGAARRTHPVAIGVRADGQPGSGPRPPGGRAADDGQFRRDRRTDGGAREEDAGQAGQRPRRQRELRPVFQGGGAPRAGRSVRLAARVAGRPARLHHARHRSAAQRRGAGREEPQGHRRPAGLHAHAAREAPQGERGRDARLPAGGAHLHGSDQRIRARAGRRPRLHREPVQSPPPGEAAVRLGVQAVRLRRGARGRVHAGDADHAVERSAARQRRGVAARGRAQRLPTR